MITRNNVFATTLPAPAWTVGQQPGDIVMVDGLGCILLQPTEPTEWFANLYEDGTISPWAATRLWVDGRQPPSTLMRGKPVAIIRCRSRYVAQVLTTGRVLVSEEQAARAEEHGWERVSPAKDGLVEVER